ncbi:hypothetical protein PENTCL1PPCAC_16625, partial [Pristionchus entomophagus]
RPDTVSVLIKDKDDEEYGDGERLVMTRRFRPGMSIVCTYFSKRVQGKTIEEIDFSSYPSEWAYTLELASGRILERETGTDAALRIAAAKVGYRIPSEKLKVVTKLRIGISQGGDSKHMFYAECGREDRIKDWKEMEGVERVKYGCSKAAQMLVNPSHSPPLPPSLFIA